MRKYEAAFQTAIIKRLRAFGFFVFAVPNGGSRNFYEAHNLKLQGVMAGVSDLIILLPEGKVLFAEVKKPNGTWRQSGNQKEFEKRVKELGFDYQIWANWSDVNAFINTHLKAVGDFLKVGGTD